MAGKRTHRSGGKPARGQYSGNPTLGHSTCVGSFNPTVALEQGDVDIARDLGADELKSIRDKPEYNFVNTDSLQQMYLGMNMGGEQLKSEQVRQAIKWAIDYRSIAEHLTAHTWSVWQSFEPKGIPGAISGNFQRISPRLRASLPREASLKAFP